MDGYRKSRIVERKEGKHGRQLEMNLELKLDRSLIGVQMCLPWIAWENAMKHLWMEDGSWRS
jgi:hypothetical protein